MIWFRVGGTGWSTVGEWLGRLWTVVKRIGWNTLQKKIAFLGDNLYCVVVLLMVNGLAGIFLEI